LADATPFTIETFTASDGYRCKVRHYPAVGTARGRIVYLHGIQSHGGWYKHSCAELSKAGFTVDFLDRRGSGLNDRDRGDAPSFRRLLDDVAELLQASGSQQPVFLIAVSWGGKLAVALQRRHPGLVQGIALLCPGLCPRIRPSFLRRLRIFVARLLRPKRAFPIPLNDPELFTATPHWLAFLREDPLALHEATARFLVESVRLDFYLRWLPARVRLPVLLLLAERDRIIDNAATRRFVERFALGDKQIIEYPSAHHTLEFEPDPERFLGDLRQWLDRLTATA